MIFFQNYLFQSNSEPSLPYLIKLRNRWLKPGFNYSLITNLHYLYSCLILSNLFFLTQYISISLIWFPTTTLDSCWITFPSSEIPTAHNNCFPAQREIPMYRHASKNVYRINTFISKLICLKFNSSNSNSSYVKFVLFFMFFRHSLLLPTV